MKLRIGVIFGGKSVEHEVSVISALQAIDNIDKEKYDIIPLYIDKDRKWYTGEKLFNIENYKNIEELKTTCKEVVLTKNNDEFVLLNIKGLFNKIVDKIDIAFPIVHGQNVEDGTLSGYLETIGIPYVGSGVLGASLGQDKVVLKQVLKESNLPIVDYVWFYDNEFLNDNKYYLNKIKKIGYPVVVKPASLGSSVGITYVKTEDDIIKAIEEAINYDKKIVVEKAVDNLLEVNCSVIGDYEIQETSVIEEVICSEDILSFDDKYVGNGKTKGQSKGMVSTSRIIPARISKELENNIKNTSKEVFKALNLSGVCRIDYLINKKTNEYYINEPNTIPGSLSFYLWEPLNKKYKDLLNDLIRYSLKEFKNKNNKTSSFDTNILSNYNKNGIKNKKI